MGKSWNEFKEHSVKSGIGTALTVMHEENTKYSIFCAVESLPAVFGTPNTIEFSSTTNWTITNVRGKNTTENIEINIPYNVDNIALCEKVKGKTLKYAYIDLDDFTGQEFVAEASYHMAEVGTDSIKMIVLSLTVKSATDGITEDLYDLFMDTVSFDDTIPSVVRIDGTETKTIKFGVAPSGATVTANSESADVATATYATGTLTIKGVKAGSTFVNIDATNTNYASNSRRIKVIVE